MESEHVSIHGYEFSNVEFNQYTAGRRQQLCYNHALAPAHLHQRTDGGACTLRCIVGAVPSMSGSGSAW